MGESAESLLPWSVGVVLDLVQDTLNKGSSKGAAAEGGGLDNAEG